MTAEKLNQLRQIELQAKADREAYLEALRISINLDINVFKQLPLEQRKLAEIAKIAFQKVGANVWFSTAGLAE
jgi:hypothetical protein